MCEELGRNSRPVGYPLPTPTHTSTGWVCVDYELWVVVIEMDAGVINTVLESKRRLSR